MSEDLRYNEMDGKFNDLPMPNEEASWQKMKELLDDDGDEIVLPPVFLKSCLGWGLLLLAGVTVAWLMVRPEKWWNEDSGTHQVTSSGEKEITNKNEHLNQNITTSKPNPNTENIDKGTTSPQPLNRKTETKLVTNLKSNNILSPVDQEPSRPKEKDKTTNKIAINNQKPFFKKPQNNISKVEKTGLKEGQKSKQETVEKEKIEKAAPDDADNIEVNKDPNKTTNSLSTVKKPNNEISDTEKAVTNEHSVNPVDTTRNLNPDQQLDSIIQKKRKAEKKKLAWTIGIGEQQLIPIAGQTTVPYSRYGRKGSLADYVPSVFVQLQKENKWFVQTEFRYGAAQSVKEFSYNRNTKFDAANNNVTITTMRLKKTYYHQLPVSFNYLLMSKLSVGIGGIYSRFYGAVTEKETTTFNTQTQTVSTSKQIIPVKQFTDSFLYKTQLHTLLQADYHWKKFSFGLRYTKDIQPYIKYTKPDGTLNEEKNQSLQLIVRYRLWQAEKL